MSPRCIVCHQTGLKITATSRGDKGLYFAKELRQLRVLDDLEGGSFEWRTAFVCVPCYGQCAAWIAPPDFSDAGVPPGEPVPVLASHVVAGHHSGFRTGGRHGLRLCESIAQASLPALRPHLVGGVEQPAFPPPALTGALGRLARGVTREHVRKVRAHERRMAQLAKKARSDPVVK